MGFSKKKYQLLTFDVALSKFEKSKLETNYTSRVKHVSCQFRGAHAGADEGTSLRKCRAMVTDGQFGTLPRDLVLTKYR